MIISFVGILSLTIIATGLIVILMIISSSKDVRIIEMGYSRSRANDNNTNFVNTINSTKLPVLLIHGYMTDSTVWNK
ncbi:MAG TPA: hypothetical protein VFM31_09790 [Nitrososphaeraceae archaeon]|nr:hypothetical protein [Nitrososphaeraceae archaeon]